MIRRLASLLLVSALAANIIPVSAADISSTPTARPCYRTLKFAGLLFLDQDRTVPDAEIGPNVGVTEPNPAKCGMELGRPVYKHANRPTTQEVVYRLPDGSAELFVSAGETGLPSQNLVRVLVLILALVIIIFALLPAILGHMRRPPIEVEI